MNFSSEVCLIEPQPKLAENELDNLCKNAKMLGVLADNHQHGFSLITRRKNKNKKSQAIFNYMFKIKISYVNSD